MELQTLAAMCSFCVSAYAFVRRAEGPSESSEIRILLTIIINYRILHGMLLCPMMYPEVK